MHELRKANKGNRHLARRIEDLESKLKAKEYRAYQFYMAMAYMAGSGIQPYEGWTRDAQFWIDKFEERNRTTD